MKADRLSYTVIAVLLVSASACLPTGRAARKSEPSFFSDTTPAKGPWKVEQREKDGFYAKVYSHKIEPVIIISSFIEAESPPPVDATNPQNQKALAQGALKNICEGIGAECSVRTSDMVWLVGSPLKYIYVRFRAQKGDYPIMTGLMYYRYDPPIQTMYMLMAAERTFPAYEDVFSDYVAGSSFGPEPR